MKGGMTHSRPWKRLKGVTDLLDVLDAHLHRPVWWPAETPFEVCAGAVLTQNTNWRNAEKALARLRAEGLLDPAAIPRTGREELETLVRESGFYRRKAETLRVLASYINERHGGRVERLSLLPTSEARRELLSLRGIGEETADAILLYACGVPVFVADAYARRLFSRTGLASGNQSYSAIRKMTERELGGDAGALGRLHALVVETGKRFCRRNPLCGECFLSGRCATGRLLSEQQNGIAEHKDEE